VKRRIDKQTLIVSTGVAIGIVLIVWGFSTGTTGREAQRIPVVIERMAPGPGDQVVQQAQVSVDFVEGYEASLTIDNIILDTTRLDELSDPSKPPKPGAQVELPPTAIYDPGNFIISYTPQIGAPIETFTQGKHTAVVRYWKTIEGPTKAKSFTWEFEAN
jgi:hypothetical protein